MANPYIKAQCQNMISVITTFSKACELAAYEDDGVLSKGESRQLRKICAVAERFQTELKKAIEG